MRVDAFAFVSGDVGASTMASAAESVSSVLRPAIPASAPAGATPPFAAAASRGGGDAIVVVVVRARVALLEEGFQATFLFLVRR